MKKRTVHSLNTRWRSERASGAQCTDCKHTHPSRNDPMDPALEQTSSYSTENRDPALPGTHDLSPETRRHLSITSKLMGQRDKNTEENKTEQREWVCLLTQQTIGRTWTLAVHTAHMDCAHRLLVLLLCLCCLVFSNQWHFQSLIAM